MKILSQMYLWTRKYEQLNFGSYPDLGPHLGIFKELFTAVGSGRSTFGQGLRGRRHFKSAVCCQ